MYKKSLFLMIVSFTVLASAETSWLGGLRQDGVILPLLNITDSVATTPWPVAEIHPFVPITTLSQVPSAWRLNQKIPETWKVLRSAGDVVTLKVEKPINVFMQCHTVWGLKTNTQPSVPSEADFDFVGVATTGASTPVGFHKLDLLGEESRALSTFITPLQKLESGVARESTPGKESPQAAVDEIRFATLSDNQTLYQVHSVTASPTLGTSTASSCESSMSSMKWIMKSLDGKLTLMKGRSVNGACPSQKQGEAAFSTGVVTNGNSTYIITVEQKNKSLHYVISRLRAKEFEQIADLSICSEPTP